MSKLAISVIGSAAVLGSVVIAGVGLSRATAPGTAGTQDLSSVASELSALRGDLESLITEVRALREAQESSLRFRLPPAAEAGSETAEASGESPPNSLPGYVAAVLAEERKLQEEERERQREERRTRMEARRQELEAMREGPYDRYNLKVNSLGKVLGLTDAQKQSYHALSVAYGGKLEEAMKQMRDARETRRAAGEGAQGSQDPEGPRGPGRGGRGDPGARDQFRELFDGLQKGFAAEVTSLLSAEQAQIYGELSRSARSFQSTDLVAAPGDDEARRFAGFGRGGGPGGTGRRGR